MLLKRLCEAPGVYGREEGVRELIARELPCCACDRLGNLTATLPGREPQAAAVLLCARMDEPGALVTGIQEDGTLSLGFSEGVDPRTLPGRYIRVGEGAAGVVGLKAIHLVTPGEFKHTPAPETLYGDIGAVDGRAAARRVRPGDPVWFDEPFAALGACYRGRALADRAACAALIGLANRRWPGTVHLLFAVQGGVGLAATAARLRPERALLLGGVEARDLPGEAQAGAPRLGGGPVLPLTAGEGLPDPGLRSSLVAAADRGNIPWQPGPGPSLARLRERGIPAAAVALPVRYAHSPAQVADPRDMQAFQSLLERYLEEDG